MTIEPRRPTQNVNVGRQHPLVELAWLLSGALAVVAVLYLAVGWSVEWAVKRLPPALEQTIVEQLPAPAPGADPARSAAPYQVLLERLLVHAPSLAETRRFQLSLTPSPDVNAYALPGGQIVLLTGLLDAVDSENELAMVLGHELGHYAGRDHLRRIGRTLVLAVLSTVVLGSQSDLSQWLYGTVNLAEARFSREQELDADAFALELLHAEYGHVGGSTAFFERIDTNQGMAPAWMRTHPHGAVRAQRLQQLAALKGWTVDTTRPPPDRATR